MKSLITKAGKWMIIPLAVLFGAADDGLVTFSLRNDTAYDIYYLYLSHSDNTNWGNDRLGSDDVLETGETFTCLVYPSHYDVKLVDEDDDVCYVYDIDVTRDRNFRMNSDDLLDCQGY